MACVTFVGGVSGERVQPGVHAGIVGGSASIADLSRVCRHGIEYGLEDEPLGAFPGRGSFGSIDLNVAEKGKGAVGRNPNLFDAHPLF